MNAERLDRHIGEATTAQHAAFLAEVGMQLAIASFDYATVFQSVARLAVPQLADWCVIYMADRDNQLRPVALAHADASKEDLVRRLKTCLPRLPESCTEAEVLRMGRSMHYAAVDDALLERRARGREHLEALRKLGLGSVSVVPLLARGRAIGVLWCAYGTSGRRHDADDLQLAEGFASRGALAIEHARLHHEAGAAMRAREAVLARAAHELRTPLTSALGAIRLLRKASGGTVDASHDEVIDIAGRNLDAVLTLTNSLLDLLSLAAGQELRSLEYVDLAEVMSRSLDIVRPQAREKGVILSEAVPGGLFLRADPLGLEQVLVNLLANAVKFTPPGEGVTIEAHREADHVLVRVRDAGEGIAPEHVERVFEPFYQVRKRNLQAVRGTGLGLSICRQIVELHGGRIWAESQGPGRGSTFTFQLPADPAEGRVA